MKTFPVDSITVAAVLHALDATQEWDEEQGAPRTVGAEFDLHRLLEWLSGYDPDQVVPTDDPGVVEYVGNPVWHPNEIIRAFGLEIQRLREER